MNILQVIPTLNPTAGGPVEGHIQQGIEMTRHGHCVRALSLDLPSSPVDKRLAFSAAIESLCKGMDCQAWMRL